VHFPLGFRRILIGFAIGLGLRETFLFGLIFVAVPLDHDIMIFVDERLIAEGDFVAGFQEAGPVTYQVRGIPASHSLMVDFDDPAFGRVDRLIRNILARHCGEIGCGVWRFAGA